MKYLIGVVSILVILLLAWIASFNRNKVRYKPILVMLVVQVILTFILLNTSFGQLVVLLQDSIIC